MIACSTRVFFDTNHLINMTKVRGGGGLPSYTKEQIGAYARIIELICEGEITPLTSFIQPYEWFSLETSQGAYQIASLLDSSVGKVEIGPMATVFNTEVLREIMRLDANLSWALPDIVYSFRDTPPWVEAYVEISPLMKKQWRETGLIGFDPKSESMKDRVSSIDKSIEQEGTIPQMVVQLYENAFYLSKDDDPSAFPRTPADWLRKLIGSVPVSDVLAANSVNLSVDELVDAIELARCKSFGLWARFWGNYCRGKQRTNKNDHFDNLFFPAHVYADYSLTERQYRHFLSQTDTGMSATVFTDPMGLADALA
ncbi:MAG TPA: hypothetical protein P5081_17895 [Phycisphaerae bacterium]|nr:hypothetical protein [Phycisphaerae bacterium]